MQHKGLIFITLVLLSHAVFGQWECPGKIPAHLKPFHKAVPLNWALEISPSAGVMTDRTINSGMVLGGLQFFKGNHEVYVEGGMKFWQNRNELYNAQDRRLGLREAFYGFNNGRHSVKTGFMSMRTGDYFLVNERATGVAYQYDAGPIRIDANVATVTKHLSRAGVFCTKSYIYNLVMDRPVIPLGKRPRETNFSSVSFSIDPARFLAQRNTVNNESEASGEDEFEDFEESDEFDEFEEFEEFEESDEFEAFDSDNEFEALEEEKDPFIKISQLGAIFYNEFGTLNNEFGWWSGVFGEATLPLEFKLRGELLWQETVWSDGIIFYGGLEKVHFWPNRSRTIFSAGYYTMLSESGQAGSSMSFSNMWYGEVMRLDGVDMPFWQISAKHNFPKIKTHLKVQYVQQLKAQQMTEYDFAVGKTWGKHVKTTAMFARLEALELPEPYYFARLEVRITL